MKIIVREISNAYQVCLTDGDKIFSIGYPWDSLPQAYNFCLLFRAVLLKNGVSNMGIDAVHLNPDWFVPGGLDEFIRVLESLPPDEAVPVVKDGKVITCFKKAT